MELQQLRYFLEVARTQHITRSAENLRVAQPSLSQAMHRLEAELGVKLFAARGRGIVLTEYGAFLRDRLTPLMQRMDALPEQIRRMADPEQTTIRLHVTAASLVVSEAIIEYRRLHEKTGFQSLLGDDESLFDVGIEAGLATDDAPDADTFTCVEKICLAVPDTAQYAGGDGVRLADFRDADFISLIAQKQFRQICDRFCAEAGFNPRIAFESDNPETVRNMIAAHMGVGFWPAFTWGGLKMENMRLMDIREPVCRRSIVIRMHKNRMDSRTVEDFFRFLTGVFAERVRAS